MRQAKCASTFGVFVRCAQLGLDCGHVVRRRMHRGSQASRQRGDPARSGRRNCEHAADRRHRRHIHDGGSDREPVGSAWFSLAATRATTREANFHTDTPLAEIDADQRITTSFTFDPDDLDAAFEELDARYLAGEAAPTRARGHSSRRPTRRSIDTSCPAPRRTG